MTCDDFHQTVVMLDEPASALAGLPDVSGHAASCSGCREWFGRYVDGASQWAEDGLAGGLATSVLRRTSGEGCSSARTRLASAYDDDLDRADRLLLDEHLAGCDGCRVFRQTLSATLAALPSLANLEPDRAFVGDVLARTSRRPARAGWFVHVQDTWQRVVQRPRFAWEAAYVCTLCWLLLFGQPMAAFDWTSARVSAVAHTAAAEVEPAPFHPEVRPDLVAGVARARHARTRSRAARGEPGGGDRGCAERMATCGRLDDGPPVGSGGCRSCRCGSPWPRGSATCSPRPSRQRRRRLPPGPNLPPRRRVRASERCQGAPDEHRT